MFFFGGLIHIETHSKSEVDNIVKIKYKHWQFFLL